jgi:hypothetical protein
VTQVKRWCRVEKQPSGCQARNGELNARPRTFAVAACMVLVLFYR